MIEKGATNSNNEKGLKEPRGGFGIILYESLAIFKLDVRIRRVWK